MWDPDASAGEPAPEPTCTSEIAPNTPSPTTAAPPATAAITFTFLSPLTFMYFSEPLISISRLCLDCQFPTECGGAETSHRALAGIGSSLLYPVWHAAVGGKNRMTRFLARRLLNYLVLLALASFLTFTLTSLNFKPLDSLEQRNPRPPQSAIDAKRTELGLDQPIPLRYANWAADAVRGDFGTTVTGQPVADELWRRIGVTLRLLVIGAISGAVIGVVVGAWGAIRQYRLSDRVITVLSLLVISTPSFVVANMLILAALNVNSILGVQIFEYTGETAPVPVGGAWDQFVDRLQHLVLPTFTLALMAIAGYSRYQRNAMLDVLGQDFIRTARAKGLTRRRALFKHGLRTALIPMATLFAYGVAGLVTGSVFVEKIFGWHGMGEWVVQGIATQDTNIIAAITVFTGTVILVAGLLSDVIYAMLDPRVRVT